MNKVYHHHILYCQKSGINQRVEDCVDCEWCEGQTTDYTTCIFIRQRP